MAYSKQTWDTTSYVNPTRMNHIEDGIFEASNGWTYIGNYAITTTNQDITIPSIANYNEFLLLGRANNERRGSMVIPRNSFITGYLHYILCSAGTIGTVFVKYVNDTKIQAYASANNFNYLEIYAK